MTDAEFNRILTECGPKHCQCEACKDGVVHDSDCPVHNEPAWPKGPCDCGAGTGTADASSSKD